MSEPLIENIDYYFDEFGRMVFTKEYHLKRGYCCGNNCLNCPWRNNDNERDNK
ncbi:MAG: hypothetical protein JWN78_2767 [Bacteroidota bacterium]|nr:hypothetical protein [Bacteroidota bacterium]